VSSCAQLRRRDKITRGACACNGDKVIFENALNWTTRSFIFAKQGEYEHGPHTPEPSGELSCAAHIPVSFHGGGLAHPINENEIAAKRFVVHLEGECVLS